MQQVVRTIAVNQKFYLYLSFTDAPIHSLLPCQASPAARAMPVGGKVLRSAWLRSLAWVTRALRR